MFVGKVSKSSAAPAPAQGSDSQITALQRQLTSLNKELTDEKYGTDDAKTKETVTKLLEMEIQEIQQEIQQLQAAKAAKAAAAATAKSSLTQTQAGSTTTGSAADKSHQASAQALDATA